LPEQRVLLEGRRVHDERKQQAREDARREAETDGQHTRKTDPKRMGPAEEAGLERMDAKVEARGDDGGWGAA
jgi:hypothetical protein